jgi:hypothetical protein
VSFTVAITIEARRQTARMARDTAQTRGMSPILDVPGILAAQPDRR